MKYIMGLILLFLTMKNHRPYLLLLIWVGIVEGVSTLALFFVAMPMKYMLDMPLAVTISGAIHGCLFLLLVSLLVAGKFKLLYSTKLMWGGILGAILPFGPFIVDVKLYRLLQPKE